MAGVDERVVEGSKVHLCPAIIVGVNDARGLAASHCENRNSRSLEERLNAHIDELAGKN